MQQVQTVSSWCEKNVTSSPTIILSVEVQSTLGMPNRYQCKPTIWRVAAFWSPRQSVWSMRRSRRRGRRMIYYPVGMIINRSKVSHNFEDTQLCLPKAKQVPMPLIVLLMQSLHLKRICFLMPERVLPGVFLNSRCCCIRQHVAIFGLGAKACRVWQKRSCQRVPRIVIADR